MSSSPVEEIKERLDIVEVVGGYVKLTRAGTYVKGVCPFHKEKTPSFFVSPERGTFYCFGCGAKGDIFSFVQQFEGVDFPQALTMLGERAGVEITRQDPKQRERRNLLSQIMEEATAIFERNLAGAADVRGYLMQRGLEASTVSVWRLGYAPDEWRSLFDELKGKGYSEALLEEAGLIKRAENRDSSVQGGTGAEKTGPRYYDRFRGRIMFPIFDAAGAVVGFSGRLFSPASAPATSSDREPPKYLNSPETPLYNKSRVLYGFDRAKRNIKKYNCSVVVEGQMDLLASHQAGFANTVALSGTALTGHQLEILKRLSPNVVLALDADAAGIASAGKSAKLALAMGMNVKVAALPQGVDPAELVRQGKDGLRKAIREAEHIVDFYLDMLGRASYDSRTFRLQVGELVFPFIRSIENKIDQAHFVDVVANRLSVPAEVVWEELRKMPVDGSLSRNAGAPQRAAAAVREPLSRRDVLLRALRDLVAWQGSLPEPTLDVQALTTSLAELEARYTLPPEELTEEDSMFRAEALFGKTENLQGEADDLLRNLEVEVLRDRLVETMHTLRAAEGAGDEEKARNALEACKGISDALHKLEGKRV